MIHYKHTLLKLIEGFYTVEVNEYVKRKRRDHAPGSTFFDICLDKWKSECKTFILSEKEALKVYAATTLDEGMSEMEYMQKLSNGFGIQTNLIAITPEGIAVFHKEEIKLPRKLKTFLNTKELEFGDFLLFQEYKRVEEDYRYSVSKPILVVYVGYFVADQTLGFNYVKWVNPNHTVYVSNEHVKNFGVCPEAEIETHIEWDDYIDVLGHWKVKPTWKEILTAYRTMNKEPLIDYDQFDIK